ncbi:MAG: CopD family protein [Myxococcales bacterium]|nr:CopD family protein [Myxococcales bacterium]
MRWLSLPTALVALHVLANVVWIGSILSVALLLARAPLSSAAGAGDVAALAQRLYARLASPAFFMSFAAGLARLSLQPAMYLHMPWMHAKLTCALVVIGLHHVIGARARRLAAGGSREEAARRIPMLGAVIFAAAALAVLLGVYKTLP